MVWAIAGVSGRTGRVAAETLLAAGEKVRVIVRKPENGEPWRARGAEVAVADLGDVDALATALKGATGAYVLLPPRMAPGLRAFQLETGKAIVAAVEKARPGHVVLLSSIGAQLESGTGPIAGLYPVEKGLREVNSRHPEVAVTFLRAGYFMENFGMSFGAIGQGILPGFMPIDTPIDAIATVDIGRTAATLLREGGKGVQAVQLGGPALTPIDVASALTRKLGQPIRAVEAPLDQLVPTMTGFGVPTDIAELYREMTGAMLAGRITWEPGHRRIEGTTKIETVVAELLAAGSH